MSVSQSRPYTIYLLVSLCTQRISVWKSFHLPRVTQSGFMAPFCFHLFYLQSGATSDLGRLCSFALQLASIISSPLRVYDRMEFGPVRTELRPQHIEGNLKLGISCLPRLQYEQVSHSDRETKIEFTSRTQLKSGYQFTEKSNR